MFESDDVSKSSSVHWSSDSMNCLEERWEGRRSEWPRCPNDPKESGVVGVSLSGDSGGESGKSVCWLDAWRLTRMCSRSSKTSSQWRAELSVDKALR